MQFKCPVCDSPEYERVTVDKPDGRRYTTEFFSCVGCSLMFREPELFASAPELRASPLVRNACMAHEVSLRRQQLKHRYIRAQLKRVDGGIDPTPEKVAAEVKRTGG